MALPPPPDPRDLLPPLLACLPTAFVSPRPPPALLPLLSPLLRQRATYLAADTTSQNEGWLPLLSWDVGRAAKLPRVVEGMHLEPHPVSGEIELDDMRPAKYRRLDEETLHARLEVEQFELLPIFVWCESDEHGATGPGWKLAELRSIEDLDDGTEWYDTIPEATEAASTQAIPQIRQNGAANGDSAHQPTQNEDEDDDDYWASYDRTPGRTPAQKNSPAPPAMSSASGPTNRQRTQSELDYYARYGSEVQPAMDAHDPDEAHPELGESTVNGDSLVASRSPPQPSSDGRTSRPNGTSLYPADTLSPLQTIPSDVSAPQPISPTSSTGSNSVERLESKAAEMSEALSLGGGMTRGSDRAQMAVKQHVSTDIKSLFRLARSSGMEREEFERIVRTELDCLGMMEEEG